MKPRTAVVKIISGELYEHLKDVRLWGAIRRDGFTILMDKRELLLVVHMKKLAREILPLELQKYLLITVRAVL